MSRYPKGNTLSDILLNGLLGLLSYFVPKNRHRVLLGSLRGRHFRGNPKYLYLHLCGHSERGLKPLWITANQDIYNSLATRGLPVVHLRSLAGFWALLRAGSLVISHSIEDVSYFQYLPGRFRKIHAYHGLPLKGHIPNLKQRRPWLIGYLLLKRERQSNALFLTCSDYTAKLEQGFLYPPGTALGYPRNDVFFDHERIFEDHRDTFALGNYAKTILYCPTFRDFDNPMPPFSKGDLDALSALLKENNYLLLVSSHHLDTSLDISAIHSGHIVSIGEAFGDIQDLLPFVDLMISDYSSIVFDFMLTGKPIIYYCHDFTQYIEARGFMVDYYQDLQGPFCPDASALMEAIQTVDDWGSSDEYLEKYARVTALFHTYRDGDSSARVAAAIASGQGD